uniref:Predicted nuclease of the RNAse H fold, HicB family n=1 Tax=Candidatus Kentrum sp. SD TaxID=2126332 RepID=A0A450YRN4_9GAMM|nr:MAG: Predicted nuclease of the RNAse H fold, HicB family [Candidatus Kentron sp. SD]VFK44159.1 MAG: Predicted nuclease of the RNAse H fold, HicB family [Candidatus Kentron sp. SD]VFK77889.1 MAG: Predicted nuclease of the RNAse H fold, HicB family [Candidatus Kentron sp. SD]
MKLKILFHQAEEGGFQAEIPGLPGCISEGDDLDETLANIRETAEGWIAVAIDRALSSERLNEKAQVAEIEL